jgi:hypothetical protein
LRDRIEQFLGVWANPFRQADLSDAHANTPWVQAVKVEWFMARTFSANGRQRVLPLPGRHGRPAMRFW